MIDNEPLTLNDDYVEPVALDDEEQEDQEQVDWIGIARQSYRDSTDFLDAGLRNRWKKNISLANSKHPSGSKYHAEEYKRRSRAFRGKTASAIKSNEAACAVALFSTSDAVDISAGNSDNKEQVLAAKAVKALTNERLEASIPWFITVMGAYKDGLTIGSVISKQYWQFEEEEFTDGLLESVTVKKEDKPVVELLPIENVRIHPGANWVDPINSSPYVIHLIPMYIADIKAREDWVSYPDDVIASATRSELENETIRRERNKVTGLDPQNSDITSVTDHDIVWVHEVFLRKDGVEVVYFTLGTELMLSDVLYLEEAYPHCIDGKRPFVLGSTEIAPHLVYAEGLPSRIEELQGQANTLSNQRFDNVEQVLNRRKFVRRGANIDYRALNVNAPGVSVEMDDPSRDVLPEQVQDVTSSSYQEQNYINLDIDELAGTFSQSSISSNRTLNETVGGMQLLQGNTNTLTEYQLRIFVETWVEPVVKQVVLMVQGYEDEETIFNVTGMKLKKEQLSPPVKVRVSAGFGATDPARKVQKMMLGLETLAKINPQVLQEADYGEIVSEVFGALGFRDGLRFFPSLAKDKQEQQPDPQMQQYIETKQAEQQGKAQIAEKNNQTKLQIEQMKIEGKNEQILAENYHERELELDKISIDENLSRDDMDRKAQIERDRLTLDSAKEMNRQADVMNTTAELKYKMSTGNEGI